MPRGNAVPHVRKTALKGLPAQFGSHFEGADELAHRAGVRKYWVCCQAISLLTSLLPDFNLLFFEFLIGSLRQQSPLASNSGALYRRPRHGALGSPYPARTVPPLQGRATGNACRR